MERELEFPEVRDFLAGMKVKKGLFGYDKEDVLQKMQQLDRMYRERLLLLKGRLEEEKRVVREELEQERGNAAEYSENIKREAEIYAEQLRREAQEEREELREELRREERAILLAELAEERKTHQKELSLLDEELNRTAGQIKELQARVKKMAEEQGRCE